MPKLMACLTIIKQQKNVLLLLVVVVSWIWIEGWLVIVFQLQRLLSRLQKHHNWKCEHLQLLPNEQLSKYTNNNKLKSHSQGGKGTIKNQPSNEWRSLLAKKLVRAENNERRHPPEQHFITFCAKETSSRYCVYFLLFC